MNKYFNIAVYKTEDTKKVNLLGQAPQLAFFRGINKDSVEAIVLGFHNEPHTFWIWSIEGYESITIDCVDGYDLNELRDFLDKKYRKGE